MKRERKTEFEKSLMLFFTGRVRVAAQVEKTKIDNFKNRKTELNAMQAMVDEAASILHSKTASIDELGKLLGESWKLKRTLSSSVSNPAIDGIYQAGMDAGALGGKILGAGGGGFILFFVRPEKQQQVREKLQSLLHVNFQFEDTGSRIVLYDPKLL